MIYDKHAYKTVVVISSYIDEIFFLANIYLALYLRFNDGNNFNPMEFSEKWILSKCNCIIFLRILQCCALPTCTLCSITEELNLINTTARISNLILLINCWEKKFESISFFCILIFISANKKSRHLFWQKHLSSVGVKLLLFYYLILLYV